MKTFDISQELFSCKVYPNNPSPKREPVARISAGSSYNLSAFSMCVHNGTHVDAPFHFLDEGKTIDELPLEKFIGMAYVAEHEGSVTAEDARDILRRARACGNGCDKRILLKGDAELSLEAAKVFAEEGILLFGNEAQTVGPRNAHRDVHKVLLEREIVLLEGIRLQDVPEGPFLLNCAPLRLSELEGAPCRAVLMLL